MAFGQGGGFVSDDMVDLNAGSARYVNIKDLKGERLSEWLQQEIKYWEDFSVCLPETTIDYHRFCLR